MDDLDSLRELATHLQECIGTLAMQARQPMGQSNVPKPPSGLSPNTSFSPNIAVKRPSALLSQRQPCQTRYLRKVTPPRKRYCGPTSPDYSLNVAQIRMRQTGLAGHRAGLSKAPSIDDHQLDEEDVDDAPEGEVTADTPPSSQDVQNLLGFRNLLTKEEAVHLLSIYQEVNGESHPMLITEHLVKQTEAWYDSESPRAPNKDISLLMINLALAIGLCADPIPGHDLAKTLYSSCEGAINAKLASPTSVHHVVVILLVGTYHFYRENLHFAWRMCGLAGNLLLELGLHSRDAREYMLLSDRECSEVVAVTCTTIVLDRQWSAATGLPTHFQESHFHRALKSSIESPYLKAMVSFIAISDRFTSPILRVATTGQPYEAEETFELLNSQIEQWRKNAVGSYNLTQYGTWRTIPLTRVPSWAILLNLRANAAHGMLLRPFFLSNVPTATSTKNIQPALDLVSDTINILVDLDKDTNFYRRQYPHYHHLLVSACALLFLIIAYVEQHHDALIHDLPDEFADSVSACFRKAFRLATAYKDSTRASRKLWKRFELMKGALNQLGILHSSRALGEQEAVLSGSIATANTVTARGHQQPQTAGGSVRAGVGHGLVEDTEQLFAGVEGLGDAHLGLESSAGPYSMWPGSLFDDWPLGKTNTFFSECEL
ncbi:hypothetical protein BDV06DRAFT_226055 [Aspergillus oleicola]